MNGLKNFAMYFVQQAHGFQREIQALLGREVFSESNRHAAHHHILGRIFHPLRKGGLKGAAVGAAVPKEFDHFNFAGFCFGGNSAVQLHVILARDKLGGALREGGRT